MAQDLNIFAASRDKYKGDYETHLLEQYKMYVEMADRISQRRQSANTFFLSINTALVTLSGFLVRNVDKSCMVLWITLVGLAGLIISYSWYRLLRSYRGLNSGKFRVIHEIEKSLPIRPYDAEWMTIGKGRDKNLYLPFTYIETKVPWVFFGLYVALIVLVCINSLLTLLCALYSSANLLH